MAVQSFGHLPGGGEVHLVTLAGGGLVVEVLTLGAIIRDMRVSTAGGWRSVVLGYAELADYVSHSPFFGAVVGRCANRIAGGQFELDGRAVDVDRNEGGRTHLHGGKGGFSSRVWDIVETGADFLDLRLLSPDGDQGYPGSVTVLCRYSISGEGLFSIDLEAMTDAPTIVNLATHSYFDLDRGDTILDHRLMIPADAVTPVDADLIPTGALMPVDGTALDFRKPRPVGDAGGSLDLNYALSAAPAEQTRLVARVEGPASGLVLEVRSTEPGLQVYDGNQMASPRPLADGRAVRSNGGLCLEPQRYPDAVHHPHFPSVVLRPGETYRQRTEYRLTAQN